MALLPLPNPDALQDDKGWISTTFYRFLSSIESEARKTDRILRFIDSPAVLNYLVEISAPYGYKITRTSTRCISGTCTLQVQINGVAIAGGDHSVSSTLQQISRTSGNTVLVGDRVRANITANSACVGLVLSIEFIRT